MNRPTPLPAPPEARLLQQELAHNAPARKALSALAENNEGEAPPADDVPPVPDYLRSRWQETYGSPAAAASRESLLQRFFNTLAGVLQQRRLAFAGGVAVAALAVTLLVNSQHGSETESGGGAGADGVVVRGGNETAVRKDYFLLLVAPKEGGDDFVKEFNLNWSKPAAQVISSAATVKELSARPNVPKHLLLADLPARELTLWVEGEITQRWPLSGGSSTEMVDSVVSQLETAVKTLNSDN